MKNARPLSLVAAALFAASGSGAANAQVKPVVATINVRVSITNLDAEYGLRAVPIAVECVVSDRLPAGLMFAVGRVTVPLQEKAATTSERATLSYSGTLSIPTYVPDGKKYVSPDGSPVDPETGAQRLAADAIRGASTYSCSLVPASRGNPDQPEDSFSFRPGIHPSSKPVLLVTGTFPRTQV